MPDLWITANSPGEIAGWLRPVAARIKALRPDLTLKVVLLPCTFASGFEEKVAREIPAVDDVIPVAGFGRLLQQSDGPAALLHLGGDLMYAAFLARRHLMPTWAYQWANRHWDRYFTGYLVKTEGDRQRIGRQRVAEAKVRVIGDLVVDSVFDQVPAQAPDLTPSPLVTFLPGSRMREASVLLPFFLEVASLVRNRIPAASFQALLSPFLAWESVGSRLLPQPRLGGMAGKIQGDCLAAEDGTTVELIRSQAMERLAASQLAVTIPGTKTAEAACLGVPCLVILPLNLPEDIPSIGLIGLLDWIPGVGRFIKGAFMAGMVRRIGYVAQPNILAGREIVPELKGRLSPTQVSERVLSMLAERQSLVKMAAELRSLYAPFRGAADRLVDIILADLPT